jgi:hypothetical protein
LDEIANRRHIPNWQVCLESHVRISKSAHPHIWKKEKKIETISAKEVYSALVQLVIHAESITWNRFNNFLMGNSILVLAWATIFVSTTDSCMTPFVLSAICILGVLSGPAWAALGTRGRKYLDKYVELAYSMETDSTCWPDELDKHKPFAQTKESRDASRKGWSTSYFLLQAGPWCFTILYIVLLVASLIRVV